MKNLIRSKNFYIIVLCDIGLVLTAYYLAFYLRFDGQIPEVYLALFKQTAPLVLATKIFFFFVFNLYRGMWRFTGIRDLTNVVVATLLSSMAMASYFLFLNQLHLYPRSVYVMDCALTLIFIGGIRLGVRMVLNRGSILNQGFQGNGKDRKRIMVLGAGHTGEKVVREMLDSPTMKMKPVAFLDDNLGKSGKSIHGVPVRGRIKEIERFQDEFDEILIAIPSARREQIREIVSACEKIGKRFRMMPSIGELIGGQISVKAIRDVRFEDLLGREEVRLDADLISESFRDKRILITGAGGSIGSELVRQVGQYHPGALGLLDFSEYNLFQIDMATRRQLAYIPIKSYLSDIRIVNTLRRAFEDFRPHIVFHAAAYKHVPVQELNPCEAIFNNIKGTRKLADMACEYEVERFVLVSTDKAVRSTNVMGASKRVAEMLLESKNGNYATRFMTVRFGNVLGSSGSVIPIFEEQIANRMPLTVTHPEVTRYFMSMSEAAQLILQAGAMGEGGEIFILDMGRPVKIVDMARDLIRLHGLEPGKDIPIRFTGLRPGEKLYEELITEGEGIGPTKHEKIRMIRGTHYNEAELARNIDELIELAKINDVTALKKKLKEIVPEYTPQ